MPKRKPGRPKGSTSKKVEIKATEPMSNCTKLALNQVDQLNAIKNLEIVVNNITGHLSGLTERVAALEKAVAPEETPAPNGGTSIEEALA